MWKVTGPVMTAAYTLRPQGHNVRGQNALSLCILQPFVREDLGCARSSRTLGLLVKLNIFMTHPAIPVGVVLGAREAWVAKQGADV